jgi:hypothetical protein
MIVNAKNISYIIVELTKKDVHHILNGGSVYMQSYAAQDEPVLVRTYCADPTCKSYVEKDACGFCPT